MNTSRVRAALAADVLTVGLLLLSGAVALGGGFRLQLAGVRLSFTAADRLLIAAVLVAAIRHWFVLRPTLIDRLRNGVRPVLSTDAVRAALPIWLGTRFAVPLIGLAAVFLIGYPEGAHPPRVSENELLNLPMRWDAGWYTNIAAGGYDWRPLTALQQDIAFFPALPMAMRALGTVFGGSPVAILFAGVVVSSAAFLWALVYLYRLGVRDDVLGDGGRARAAVLLIACYPFAVFHGAVYTESLWLLTVVGAFWHALRHEWWRCAAWGLLSGLTRPNGCLLSVALAVLVLQMALRRDHPERRPAVAGGLAAVAAPGIGLLLYAGYIYHLTGNPLQWALVHEAWGRGSGLQELTDLFASLVKHGVWVWLKDSGAAVMNTVAALTALILIWPVTRRFGLAYGAFMFVNLLAPLLSGGSLSAGRVTSTLFPLFLWLAHTIPARHREAWVAAFAVGQGLMAVLFYTWRAPY
jgi:hypothetical protein